MFTIPYTVGSDEDSFGAGELQSLIAGSYETMLQMGSIESVSHYSFGRAV